MNCKFVFWDWNGTILDDANAACEAVNVMLESRGRKTITLDEYRSMVDVPIIKYKATSYEVAFSYIIS